MGLGTLQPSEASLKGPLAEGPSDWLEGPQSLGVAAHRGFCATGSKQPPLRALRSGIHKSFAYECAVAHQACAGKLKKKLNGDSFCQASPVPNVMEGLPNYHFESMGLGRESRSHAKMNRSHSWTLCVQGSRYTPRFFLLRKFQRRLA